MDVLLQLLISAFPILLLVGIGMYALRNVSGPNSAQQRLIDQNQEMLATQQRMADALEKLAERS